MWEMLLPCRARATLLQQKVVATGTLFPLGATLNPCESQAVQGPVQSSASCQAGQGRVAPGATPRPHVIEPTQCWHLFGGLAALPTAILGAAAILGVAASLYYLFHGVTT